LGSSAARVEGSRGAVPATADGAAGGAPSRGTGSAPPGRPEAPGAVASGLAVATAAEGPAPLPHRQGGHPPGSDHDSGPNRVEGRRHNGDSSAGDPAIPHDAAGLRGAGTRGPQARAGGEGRSGDRYGANPEGVSLAPAGRPAAQY